MSVSSYILDRARSLAEVKGIVGSAANFGHELHRGEDKEEE